MDCTWNETVEMLSKLVVRVQHFTRPDTLWSNSPQSMHFPIVWCAVYTASDNQIVKHNSY